MSKRVSVANDLPRATLKAHLITSLRDAIITRAFKPGDRLNETQLARKYGVSRIPVREALLHLQEQGLVMNHPRRGMFVNILSDDDCQKINSLRIILEAEAIKLCRARLTAASEAQLLVLVERMEKWNAGSEVDAAALDLEFHRALWNLSGNNYLEKVLNSQVPMLFAHQALEYTNHKERLWPLNHHRQLLDVVLGKSEKTAEEAMIDHLRLRYTNPQRYSSLAYASLKPRVLEPSTISSQSGETHQL
ncbi:MAG: GntR family transcriptional regulator [Candidatus Sulfotelmatobacter sp.]|jgi:DNA-binding GntR family transcriptional regulator